ncbi:MAG: hypothetical protein JO339_34795, partial [Alphaproteobacteria bacterium]|nr:hypothetical protein [Alphaproteobacteria bacterium]
MFQEVFRTRQIFSVVWVHADHWEPWGQGVNEAAARRIEEFGRQIARFRFARKMTLFHLAAHNYHLLDTPREGGLSAPGDRLEFEPRSAAECDIAQAALGNLMARAPVEFQLHVHHEQFTYSDRDWNPIHSVLKQYTTPELDEQRFRFLVDLGLDILRHDTGLPFATWAFVHGNWALNASDPDVCHIESEVELLSALGAWGDFSFPAGRSHCDPRVLDVPFTIRPLRAPRCYDEPAADPRPLAAGARNFEPGRFVIWNSKAKTLLCSLDIATPFDQKRLRNRERMVYGWLRECPVIDGTLYIKTHAHSMNASYFEDGRSVPLCDPDVIGIFSLLELACEKAGVELCACTANELLARLRCLDSDAGSAAAPKERESLIVSSTDSAAVPVLIHDDVDLALEAKALDSLAGWLAQDSANKGRVGDYYADKIARRRLFSPHDRAIATYCADRFAAGTRFVELGCGVGELPLLLARRGLTAVGYESEQARFEAARHTVAALAAQFESVGDHAVQFGMFPDSASPEKELDGLRVFVCGHVTSSYMADNQPTFLASLRDFDHLVMDVSTFGWRRDEVGIQALVASIIAHGFVQAACVFVDDIADIRHFRRRTATPVVQGAAKVTAPFIRQFETECVGVLGVVGSS